MEEGAGLGVAFVKGRRLSVKIIEAVGASGGCGVGRTVEHENFERGGRGGAICGHDF